jgi:hypothetical protein
MAESASGQTVHRQDFKLVGMPKTSPQYLWIRGNRLNEAGDISGIHFYNSLNSGDRGNSRIISSRGTTNYGSNLEFWTNPDANVPALERMRILANGNVGIGTDSPKQAFEVDSSDYGLISGRLGVGNILTSAQNGGGQNIWDQGTSAKLLVRCANSANPSASYANARTYAGIAIVPGFDANDTTNMGLWGGGSGENPTFYIQNQVNLG